MINPKITLNVLFLNTKRNLSFLDGCVFDINGNDYLHASESDLIEVVRFECKRNRAKIINTMIDISLPSLFPYQGNLQTYRIDIDNKTHKSFKVNAMLIYIIFPNGRAAIVNRIESRTDHFILEKKSITTILMDIDDDFGITSVKQLYKTEKACISKPGVKHPIMFAYTKMDMSMQELSLKLTDTLMKCKNIRGYKSVSDVLKKIHPILGHDTIPIQDVIPLDIAYAINKKEFIISKYCPTIKPIWFNVLIELELRNDNRLIVSSVLTTDRVVIPNKNSLNIHSPSDI